MRQKPIDWGKTVPSKARPSFIPVLKVRLAGTRISVLTWLTSRNNPSNPGGSWFAPAVSRLDRYDNVLISQNAALQAGPRAVLELRDSHTSRRVQLGDVRLIEGASSVWIVLILYPPFVTGVGKDSIAGTSIHSGKRSGIEQEICGEHIATRHQNTANLAHILLELGPLHVGEHRRQKHEGKGAVGIGKAKVRRANRALRVIVRVVDVRVLKSEVRIVRCDCLLAVLNRLFDNIEAVVAACRHVTHHCDRHAPYTATDFEHSIFGLKSTHIDQVVQ